MRFRKGQKVVCVNKGTWIARDKPSFWERLFHGLPKGIGPAFNEIVTVLYVDDATGNLALCEYPIFYNKKRHCYQWQLFEPLVSDAQLEAELETCREPNFA